MHGSDDDVHEDNDFHDDNVNAINCSEDNIAGSVCFTLLIKNLKLI